MTIGIPSQFVQPAIRRGVTRRRLLKVGLGLTGAGLVVPGTAAYAAAEAANVLVITDYRPVPPGWPDAHRLTITVIADLHAGGPNMGIERVRQVVNGAQALNSDLIVILGDYFATHRFVTERVPHPAWAAELARLKARLGVYAILGNHDWWHDIKGVRSALAAVHMPVMENDAVLLNDRGRRFWLAGLGDQLAHVLGPGRFEGVDDLPGTLKRITTDDPVILLVHEPDIFTEVPPRVTLTLAGHTHGGQIVLPFLPPLWTPSEYGARFAYGHIVERDRHMIVSGGLG
jgi:predicted MPP superfamily phosphohydrolase